MNRFLCAFAALTILVMTVNLSSCKHASKRAAVSSGPLLAVHIATNESEPPIKHKRLGPERQVIYLSPEPLVTNQHVRRATRSTTAAGQPAVMLEMTDAGAQKLLDHADTYVNRQFAFVWRDEVISAPVVRSAVSRKLMIFNGGANGLSQEQIDDLIKTLNRHRDETDQ